MLPTNLVKLMLIMCSLLLCACGMTQDQPPIKQHVTLKLGQQGEDSFRKAHRAIDGQTAPKELVGFTNLSWSPPQLGTVTFDHGGHQIHFPHTFSALGTSWPLYPDEGISIINLRTGISATEYIRHEEAWKNWQALLMHVQENGWQVSISEYEPRIRDLDRYNYIMSEDVAFSSIDPAYPLSYGQWSNLLEKKYIKAFFYQNGVYLNLVLSQNPVSADELAAKKLDLNLAEWGQYLVEVEFSTVRHSKRNAMLSTLPRNDDDTETELKIRQNLPLYWQELKQRYAKERKHSEQNLIQQGYKIDTSYQSPDLTPYLQSKPVF